MQCINVETTVCSTHPTLARAESQYVTPFIAMYYVVLTPSSAAQAARALYYHIILIFFASPSIKVLARTHFHLKLLFTLWGTFADNCSELKVENILKGSLDSILSPSPSVKIQIMGGKVCLRSKGKTLLGIVNKLLKKKFVDITQQWFALLP
jgi:hypothetical protein